MTSRYLHLAIPPTDASHAVDEGTASPSQAVPAGVDLAGGTRPATGDAGEAGSLAPASPATSLTVDAADVEIGDLLAAHPYARVAHIWYTAGYWLYFDADMVRIAYHPLGGPVDVVRVEGP